MSDVTEVFHSILFELGNAVNTELQSIKYGKYENADEFADNTEKVELLTGNNTSKLIVELMQYKPEAAKKMLKQINTSKNYQDLLKENQELAKRCFEDYQIQEGERYEAHRNSYYEDWLRWENAKFEKLFSKLKQGYSPEMYEGKNLEDLRTLFKKPSIVNSGRKMIQIFNMQRLKIDTVS